MKVAFYTVCESVIAFTQKVYVRNRIIDYTVIELLIEVFCRTNRVDNHSNEPSGASVHCFFAEIPLVQTDRKTKGRETTTDEGAAVREAHASVRNLHITHDACQGIGCLCFHASSVATLLVLSDPSVRCAAEY